MRRCLTAARIAALLLGLPLIMYWAGREAALVGGWNFGIVFGILLSQAAMLIYALRFRLVVGLVGIQLGLLETLRIATLGLFYQCFVPFAAGSDLTKFVKLKARKHGTLASAAGIVLDHLLGVCALTLLAVTLAGAYRPLELTVDPRFGAALAIAIATLAALILRWLDHSGRVPAVRAALRVLRKQRRGVGLAVAAALATYMLLAAAVWSAARGSGLETDYPTILFVLSATSVLQAVPAQLLGIGVAELAATALYVAVGHSPAAAVLLTSFMVGYRLLMALIGGLWDLGPVDLSLFGAVAPVRRP
ncbi:MAG: lysylphosphatidylglycerol synthase domain-containing protein, partial [Gammaproteobacteria bacterium]